MNYWSHSTLTFKIAGPLLIMSLQFFNWHSVFIHGFLTFQDQMEIKIKWIIALKVLSMFIWVLTNLFHIRKNIIKYRLKARLINESAVSKTFKSLANAEFINRSLDGSILRYVMLIHSLITLGLEQVIFTSVVKLWSLQTVDTKHLLG